MARCVTALCSCPALRRAGMVGGRTACAMQWDARVSTGVGRVGGRECKEMEEQSACVEAWLALLALLAMALLCMASRTQGHLSVTRAAERGLCAALSRVPKLPTRRQPCAHSRGEGRWHEAGRRRRGSVRSRLSCGLLRGQYRPKARVAAVSQAAGALPFTCAVQPLTCLYLRSGHGHHGRHPLEGDPLLQLRVRQELQVPETLQRRERARSPLSVRCSSTSTSTSTRTQTSPGLAAGPAGQSCMRAPTCVLRGLEACAGSGVAACWARNTSGAPRRLMPLACCHCRE